MPSWLLPARLVLAVTAALGYVAALHFRAIARGDDGNETAAIAFLMLALAATVGSLVLRTYARVQRRQIIRQIARPNTAYAAVSAPRMIVGPAPAKPRNAYAGTALLYGVASFVVTIVAAALGYYIVGLLGFFAVYYGIRGVAAGARLYIGLASSLVGLVLGVLSLLLTFLLATGLLQVVIGF